MGFKVDSVFVDFAINFDQGEASARRINEAMAKLGRVSGVAADAADRTERATRRFGASARKAAKDTRALGAAATSAGSQIKGMLKTLLGLELARRAVRGLLSTFLGFRKAMNLVRAITNATDADFKRLKATALELGRTTQFTATAAAEAMAFLARTGLDVNETIAVLPATLNLAAATAVDLGTAADISTNILMAMGLQISELEGVIDVLAFTTNRSNVNIFELSEAMKLVAPIASDAGVSVQRLSAMIGILGDAGIKGTLAGTALRKSILQIQTGAGTAGEVLAGLGIQVEDAEGKFVGLDEVLRAVEGGLVSDAELFKVFGLRAISAAKVLAGRGVRDIDKFEAAIDRAGGTAERMAGQQMAGLVGATKLLTSETQASAIMWGDSLEPALIRGAQALGLVVNVMEGLRGMAEIVGGALFLLARTFLFTMETAIEGVGALVSRAISTLGFFTERAGALVALLPGKFGELGEKIQGVGDSMLMAGQRGQDAMGESFERTLDQLKFAWQGFKEQVVETADSMGIAGLELRKAEALLKKLEDATNNASAAMQRARTALNLDVFTAQLTAVRELLRETFGFEGEGALNLEQRLEIQRQLVAMNEKQVDGVMALVDAEQTLAAAVNDVLAVQAELNAAGADQEKIAELTAELEQAVSALAAATRAADQAMDDLGESGKGLGELLGRISLAVRGINRIADAFGLVNNDVRKAIDSVLDLINTFKALEAAKGAVSLGTALGFAGGAIGAISALGGLLGGLFGGEPSPEQLRREQERQELLRANNLALELLRQSFEKSLSVLKEFTGAEIGKAKELAAQGIGALFPTFKIFDTGLEQIRRLTGAELEFLKEVAAAFGLTIDGTVESFEALITAIDQIDLARLTETFAGAMDLLQRRFAIFDIDKPIDRLVAMLGLLEEFGDLNPFGLVNLPDVLTEGGRAALEQFIKALFEQIEAGTFDIARLGGLTLEDFLNLLGSMEELLDDIEEDGVGVDDEGLSESFVRTTRITEIQGNELLTLQRTMLVIDRLQLDTQMSMLNVLSTMAGVPPPAPAAAAAASMAAATVNVGGVSVTATIAVTEEVDVDALVARLGTDLAVVIDRELSELQTRESRALGEPHRFGATR